MPALTGVMTADFTQFATEVDRSVIKLQQLERGATETDSALGGFSDGLSQVDKTLGAVGVRISPQIQAMRELGAASGKTASELGLVGTAGLAVGAAMAGWQLGRMAAEWLGLDAAIGNATAKLLGWGDVAGQTAGARMDVLTRATQLAGRAITDFGEAQRIIVEHNKAAAESLNTGTERVRQWNAELDKARASGALATITKELKEGSSTVKQLAQHFNISAEAIQYHTQRTKENATILNEWRENAAKVATAQAELNQLGGGWRATLDTIAPAVAAVVTQQIAQGASLATLATAHNLTTIQVNALNTALQTQTRTIQLQEPALGSLSQFMAGLAPAILEAGKSTQFFDQQLMASIATVEEAAIPQLEKLEETFRSVTEAAKIAAEPSKNAPGSVGVNLGGLAFGSVGVEAAMKAYTARFGSGSAAGAIGGGPAPDFLSWAMKMGYATKGTQISNTFNVVDTESEIARRVSEEISRQIQRGSLVT